MSMSGEPRPPFGKAGTTPQAGPDPAAPGGADPSMEDILASIRRILNEEDASVGGAAGGGADPAAEDALDLSEDMLVAEPSPADPPPAAPPPAAVMAPPAAPPPPGAAQEAASPVSAIAARAAEQAPEPAPTADTLLAPAAAAAATASLGTLLRTVAAERSSAIARGGPTIEDVVREAIRPMLKEWLDQHLPPMVERLVRAEIERVVGRALS